MTTHPTWCDPKTRADVIQIFEEMGVLRGVAIIPRPGADEVMFRIDARLTPNWPEASLQRALSKRLGRKVIWSTSPSDSDEPTIRLL